MTSSAAAIINQTIYRNNSKTRYTKIDNNTLRLRFPEEKSISAKDILLYALSCQSNWLITAETISGYFKIPLKTIRKKLSILSRHGHAKPERVIDPKSHKTLMVKWAFYEKPLPPKEGQWKNHENPNCDGVIPQKTTTPKRGAMVSIYKNKQHKEKTTEQKPQPDPPESHIEMPPKNDQPTAVLFSKKQMEKMGDHAEQIETACQKILDSTSKPGIPFNPMQAVGKSLSDGKQPGAIAETLSGMAIFWDTIESPWGIYERQMKIKNQNWNAREAEIMNEKYKKLLK